MERLKVFIVDDEPAARETLRTALRAMDDVEIVGESAGGEAAVEAIATAAPDIAILDVEMPGLDGLALASRLQGPRRPEIVFLTGFQEYAARAFEVEAVDYLIKPLQPDRLRAAIDRAHRRALGRAAVEEVAEVEDAAATAYESELWVPDREGYARVRAAAIEWVEAAGDYALLHTSLRSHMLRATLSGLSRRLDPRLILRVHRSAMVAPRAVRRVTRSRNGRLVLVLESEVTVPVGDVYHDEVAAVLGL
ncbi:MAG: DNA-binding response regulator [Phenylobacterium zucineum]|nr:MAG: DNA-binding response regulator [Phenylobacterium zucineum]